MEQSNSSSLHSIDAQLRVEILRILGDSTACAVWQPRQCQQGQIHHEVVQSLASDIILVRRIAQEHQTKRASDCSSSLPEEHRTQFQPDDYVPKKLGYDSLGGIIRLVK